MASTRVRIRILSTFSPKKGEPGHGFKYVEGAIVGVSLPVARQWIEEKKATPYDAEAKAALEAPASSASVPQA